MLESLETARDRMPYNENLMKGRAWVYGIGAAIVAIVVLWKTLVH
jgi:hypothetical protein